MPGSGEDGPRAEDAVLRRFRGKVAAGDLDGIRVSVRLAGGMPSERHLDRTVTLSASGEALVSATDNDAAGPAGNSRKLSEEDAAEFMRSLSEDPQGLVPRSQARFLPDSLVGSLLVEVEGETVELFYLADEQDRVTQGKQISPTAAEGLARLRDVADRLIGAPEAGE